MDDESFIVKDGVITEFGLCDCGRIGSLQTTICVNAWYEMVPCVLIIMYWNDWRLRARDEDAIKYQ